MAGIAITIPLGHAVTPLPEGSEYLGFIFARGERPEDVEATLRKAHALLRIDIVDEGEDSVAELALEGGSERRRALS